MRANPQIKFYPILQPLAYLFGIGVKFRNWLFDKHLLPSKQYPIPVICVGNLAVGGTGKTPMIEFLIRLLSDKYRIAVLSRGYKRKSSGFVLADEKSTSLEIGDEASQINYKFPEVIVAVDKNRRRAMRKLLAMPEDIRPQAVLLDDGFQHRSIKPSFSILLTDYNRLLCDDKLLPVGRLREPAKSVLRADLVIISKSPENFSSAHFFYAAKKISCCVPTRRVRFTSVAYQPLESVFPNTCTPFRLENIWKDAEILALTGIANPAPMIAEIKKYADKVEVLSFADHHAFTKKDIQKIQSKLSKFANSNQLIICSEKDAARIRTNPHFPEKWKSRMYYLPVHTYFCDYIEKERFENQIFEHISSMIENNNYNNATN